MGRMSKWLYPGIGIKRWIFTLLAGSLISLTGVVLIIGPDQFLKWGRTLFALFYATAGSTHQTGVLLIIVGLAFLYLGARNLSLSILGLFLPKKEGQVVDMLYRRRLLQRGPHLVVIGGGTGLSVLLRGLKEYTSNITAVVNVCDDGGSSGRLRGDMGILPPGDIRNCLLALADTEPVMEKLFQHRFSTGELKGHNFGNLFIAAMSEQMEFKEAIKEFSKVLAVRGQVLPVTLEAVTLVAELQDGTVMEGQSAIGHAAAPIKKVALSPGNCRPLPEVLHAIRNADAIILGPGSLFTSVIPNLLVPEVNQAIARSRAKKYYVCNVMTQPGETTGFSASRPLEALEGYLGKGVIQHFIVNETRDIPSELTDRYREEGAELVALDLDKIKEKRIKIIQAPLIAGTDLIRHNQDLLGRIIIESLFREGTLVSGASQTALQMLVHRTISKGR
jgi:uncharacterized cofD-like protein